MRLNLTYTIICLLVLHSSIGMARPQSKFDYMSKKDPRHIAVLEARKQGIEPRLVLAILRHESRDCTLQQAVKRDLGCMQVNKRVAERMGLSLSRLEMDPSYNISVGVGMLAALQRRYKAKEPQTWFCRYNVGTGRMEGLVAEMCAKYISRVKSDSKWLFASN